MNEKTIFVYESALGNITFSFKSDFWLTDIDGVSSVDVNLFTSQGNKQTGATVTGQAIQPRTIDVDGAIFGAIPQNRQRLIDVVAPGYPATLTVTQNGQSWYLDVVPTKTPDILPGNGEQRFQMQLFAGYPYWRTVDSYATQIAGLTALFKFPFYTGGSWWISKFNENFYSALTNTGNVPIYFSAVFTARGEVVNPELYHVETGEKIRILKTMVAGEKMIVRTEYGQRGASYIANDGTASNGFRYLSIDTDLDMALQPGVNTVRIDADENRDNLSVRIEAPVGVRSGV